MAKKCLVTGGEGFIGSYICKALILQGREVISVDYRPKYEERLEGVQYHDFDIRDTEKMIEVLEGVDVIFHIAGLPRAADSFTDPQGTLSINVLGTKSVLEAAVAVGVRRVVFASSSAIYGDQDRLPVKEGDFPLPLSPYGFQKYLGEKLIQEYTNANLLEAVSLRFFNVYGYWSDLTSTGSVAITRFLTYRSLGKSLTIYGDGTQTRDFIHVKDVAKACLNAAENTFVGKGEVINIGSGKPIDVNGIAKYIGGQVEYVSGPEGEIHDSYSDISLAQELLGWTPSISLEDGISDMKKSWGIS